MRFASPWRAPSMNVVSSLLMLIWESCSRGRTGPLNRWLVGRRWPNRSTWPGPDRLTSGALAPTWITCPATVTVCIGVTCNATAIAPHATTTSSASPASHRSGRRSHRSADWTHRPDSAMPRVVPIPAPTITTPQECSGTAKPLAGPGWSGAGRRLSG